MNAAVKLQQHDAVCGSANRHRDPCGFARGYLEGIRGIWVHAAIRDGGGTFGDDPVVHERDLNSGIL